MFMDQGKVVEFGGPKELMEAGGQFAGIAAQSGIGG